eukprot:CAMPEP_0197032336 /NCGR_PEP_ID=MMETSP1384-20130603/11040_1 /TAXON_ID=29189 /ORGANISM="Ammonia sp." /LENGTH=444 /DNA_ID=CAMNT_0042461979 /DNA_START=11 /DNA_END=1342 /DNA_ORIENTATION=-
MLSWLTLSTLAIGLIEATIQNCNGGNDNVTKLAGYTEGGANPPLPKMNAGYIEVNASANGSLFYWLVQSMAERVDSSTPFLIWLNGGPGSSSLTGMFSENGPFRIKAGTKELEFFNYTWSTYYHVLFVDNPIDTGFSFCNKGQQVQTEDQMGENFLRLMQGFYKCHPEYAKNPLYITGESYAGRYIPFIWKWLTNGGIKVAGLAIGNGIYDPFIQFYSSPFYAYVNGIIDYQDYVAVNATVAACLDLAVVGAQTNDRNILNDAANICLDATNGVYEDYGGNVFQYDIRENNGSAFDGITDDLANYLNQSSVGEDIHTYGIPWKSSDGTSSPNPVAEVLNYDIVLNNSASIIPEALRNGTRILFYNGQFDGSVCNNYGNQQCLRQLNYKGEWNGLKRNAYFLDDLCIGYVKESSDKMLTYFVVADSGHLVPYNQPKNILDVIHNW